jgi:hypothetical protein
MAETRSEKPGLEDSAATINLPYLGFNSLATELLFERRKRSTRVEETNE